MAEMDVTARFRADTSDFTKNVNAMNRLYQDSAGKWRDESGKFANAAQRAAAGVGVMGDEAKKSSKGFTVLRGAIGTAIGGAAIGAFYAATTAIKNFATGSVQAAVEARQADDRIKAIATSMGVLDTTLGGSTQRILDFASKLQAQTGVSDEVIKQGQAIILTFKDVASSAGESGGMFDRATAAAVDLAAAGFGGVEQNAKSLARALQDPLKGLTMLGRQGVTFTEAEKEKIKALAESGQLLQAQTIIMSAVEKQVGGTAAATMTAGDKMRVAFDEFQETVGRAVLPIIERVQLYIAERVVPALERFVGYLQANVFPVVQRVFGDLVRFAVDVAGRIQNLVTAIMPIAPLFAPIAAGIIAMVAAWKLTSAIQTGLTMMQAKLITLRAQMLLLNASMMANPIVAIAAIAVGALAAMAVAFKMVYDRSEVLRRAVSQFMDVVRSVASVIVGQFVRAFQTLFGQQQKTGEGFKGFGDILQAVADVAGPILARAMNVLSSAVRGIGNVLQVVIKVWEIQVTVLKMVANVIRSVLIVAVEALGKVFRWLMDRLGPVGDAISRLASKAKQAFSNIPQIISGAVKNATSLVEGAINGAITAINALIRAYNKIPYVTQIAELEAFRFEGFTSSASNAASSAQRLAFDVSAYGEAAARGYRPMTALTGATKGLTDATDGATDATTKGAGASDKASSAQEKLKEKIDAVIERIKGLGEVGKSWTEFAQQANTPMLGEGTLSEWDVLTQNVNAATTAYTSFASSLPKVVTDKTIERLTNLSGNLQETLGAALEHARANLASATRAFEQFASSVSNSLSQSISFADAWSQGSETGQGFMSALQEQSNKAVEFAENVKRLIAAGLSEAALQQVLAAGADAGNNIAKELLAGGESTIDQANNIVEASERAADEVGLLAAQKYKQAGIDNATAQVNGITQQINAMTPKIMDVMDALARKMRREVTIDIKVSQTEFDVNININRAIRENVTRFVQEVTARAMGGPVSARQLYVVGERGPEFFVPNMSGTIIPNHMIGGMGTIPNMAPRSSGGGGGNVVNINVNAGMGTDGVEVGRQVVEAIRKYERRSGPVFASA